MRRHVWFPLIASVVACGRGDDSPLEREVRDGLAKQLEVAVERVTCSGGPPATSCQARVGDQWLTVSVVPAQEGGRAWSLIGVVVAAPLLERYVVAELEGLGITVAVDCGARVRTVEVGDRIACSLGDAGIAWATVEDEEGNFSLEVALGGDAVRARSEEVDTAALDELSAALDLDAPADEEAATGIDAGAEPGGP